VTAAALGDHLWQSTLFAAAVGGLTLALRRNRAQVRYWLWLAASVKFLVPFAMLVAIGGQFGWAATAPAGEPAFEMMETVTQPFSQSPLAVPPAAAGSEGPPLRFIAVRALLSIWLLGSAALLLAWCVRWRRVAAMMHRATPVPGGREFDILRRLAQGGSRPLPIVASDISLEPGVFGILRPVLLWPRSIGARLSDAQVEAILAHELSHVRRRDNLTAAIHMVVQAACWFHPLVWWIGARLVDERERACDEEVVRLGSEPEVYAESILKTCQFYVESPLACVAGVTGSNLKRRIEQIMQNDAGRTLNTGKKLLLAVAALATFAAPVTVGALNPPARARAMPAIASLPTFAAISVSANRTAGRGGRGGGALQSARYTALNLTLKNVIKMAYGSDRLPLFDQQIVGGPDWLASEKFDIDASAPGPTERPQMQLMVQRMLAERFMLAAHFEIREQPVYVLRRAQSDGTIGAGLTPTSDEACNAAASTPAGPDRPGPFNIPGSPGSNPPPCGALQFGPGVLIARGIPMEFLAQALTNTPVVTGLDRMVVDRTGLTGNHGFNLRFSPPQRMAPLEGGTESEERPSLFTALQAQLGLRLEATDAPVDVLVIDSIARPGGEIGN
jgi:bla regulator protein blaR1